MDKSTDKLRDHVCDKEGGVKKFEIFMDVIDGSPLSILPQYPIITVSLAFGGGVPLWRAVVLARERVAPVEVSLLGAVVDAPQAVHRRELLPEIKSCHVSRIQSGGIFGR